MAAEISDRVREIAEARGILESEVFKQALEREQEMGSSKETRDR